jgi:hypothetical protein
MNRLDLIQSDDHAQAIRDRDRFLENHPELKGLQARIDRTLRTAQNDHNRMVLINQLMMDAFLEMHGKLQNLVGR